MIDFDNIQTKTDSSSHYSVPEGFFEELDNRIMSSIKQCDMYSDIVKSSPKVSFRTKVKPLLYMAASFLILIGGIQIFRHYTQNHNNILEYQSKNIATLDKTKIGASEDEAYLEYFMDDCLEKVDESFYKTEF
ncbi:hypothetical protein [Porphyromonas pogonae]|uniref:hypothetical protein n=1 Tax=Porphyromonas pogonae TaxID=867595 RepID=UPI002E799E75|nr:hypothetical protein [Porphyromonas pogonae]